MTNDISERAERGETDGDVLGWWCQFCRQCGMPHCDEVEACIESGHLQQLPYSERMQRLAALARSNPDA